MIKKQRGLTAITWIVLIALIAVQGILALRIIPVYMTFGSVKSVMDSLVTDPDMKGKTAKEIKMILNRRLLVNNVKGLNQGKQKAFKFTKLSNGYKLTCHYEQRGPIISNLEFVATFDHEVEIPSR